jgi:glucose-1-phosphate thymidylyltransferase
MRGTIPRPSYISLFLLSLEEQMFNRYDPRTAAVSEVKGLLLAGGHGTRLRPLTFSGNKHMLPIANKPMLFYGLEHLVNARIKDIGVVLGPISEGVREALGDGSRFGARVTYIEQPEPKGLAHAVNLARDFIRKGPFVMYLGDNMLDRGVKPFVETFEQKKADCVIGVVNLDDPSRFGVVEMRGRRVLRLSEKPKKPRSHLALIGVYVFGPSIFTAIDDIKPSERNELEITDAIQWLVDKKKKVEVKHVDGWWKDAGRAEDLLDANRLVLRGIQRRLDGKVERSCSIIGEVIVGRGSVIRSGSKLLGPLIIGEDCVVGPDTYVGPYTSIGNRTQVVRSEIEDTIVMEDCRITDAGRIVESLLGRLTSVSASSGTPGGRRFIMGERSVAVL